MKKILYLGLDIPSALQNKNVCHCPLISIVSRSTNDALINQAFKKFADYTHLIFTSKTAVRIFFDMARSFGISIEGIRSKTLISVGQSTAARMKKEGVTAQYIATEETAEGVITVLSGMDLKNPYFLLPQSSIARSVITNWLEGQKIIYLACPIYDTMPNIPKDLPLLANFDEIFFTSPSVVDAFIQAYGSLPHDKILTAIGSVTGRYLQSILGN